MNKTESRLREMYRSREVKVKQELSSTLKDFENNYMYDVTFHHHSRKQGFSESDVIEYIDHFINHSLTIGKNIENMAKKEKPWFIPYSELGRHFTEPKMDFREKYSKLPRKIKKKIKKKLGWYGEGRDASTLYWMYLDYVNPDYKRFLIKKITEK